MKKILTLLLSFALFLGLMASVSVSAQESITLSVATESTLLVDGQTSFKTLYDNYNGSTRKMPGVSFTTAYDNDTYRVLEDDGSLTLKPLFTTGTSTPAVNLKFNVRSGYTYTVTADVKGINGDATLRLTNEHAFGKYNLTNSNADAGTDDCVTTSSYMDVTTAWNSNNSWYTENNKPGVHNFTLYGWQENNSNSYKTGSKNGYTVLVMRELPVDGAVNGVQIKNLRVVESKIETITISGLEAAIAGNVIRSGRTGRLSVSALDSASKKLDVTEHAYISYESSDKSVAEVSGSGVITAVAPGKATVTVKIGNETAGFLTDTVDIEVTDANVAATEVTVPVEYEPEILVESGKTMEENYNLVRLGNNIIPDELYTDDGGLYVPAVGINSNNNSEVSGPGLGFKSQLESGYTYKVTAKVKAYSETTEVKVTSQKKINVVSSEGDASDCAYYNDYFNGITTSEWTDIESEFTLYGWDSNGYQTGKISDLITIKEARRNTNYTDTSPKGFYIKDVTLTKMFVGDFTVNNLKAAAGASRLVAGNTTEIGATVTDVESSGEINVTGNDYLVYETSDASVATVDENGVVTAKANGTAVITVKLGDEDMGYLIDTVTVIVSDNASSVLHVATDGSDVTGDGSLEKPFATINEAKTAIRGYASLPEGGVTVYIHGGTYPVSESIEFTEEDSGTAESPIVYCAYNNETVTFAGGTILDSSKIEKVTDEALLDRLNEDYAKDNLYKLKLDDGISVKDLEGWGWQGPQEGKGKRYNVNEKFYMNGVAFTMARWPNADWSSQDNAYTSISIPADVDNTKYNDGTNWTLIDLHYKDDENRSLNWEFKKGDMMVGGAFANLWAKQDLLVGEFDAENKRFKTDTDYSAYNPTESSVNHGSCGIYFSNIFEEIDQPGEYYLDRDTMTLYFYPVGSVENADMKMSALRENMIRVSGAKHITFSGLDFTDAIETAVKIDAASENITFENAVIKGINKNGIEVNGWNHTIRGCDIYDIGAVAVYVEGGDRASLKSSGTVVTNNKIHNYSIDCSSPMVGVFVKGVGHLVSHNEIFDCVNGGINIDASNNCIVEYNEIYDVHKVNSDYGAIYLGAELTEIGDIIRYNYIHDIGGIAHGYGIQAIFSDDGNTGPAIYGNIIYNGGMRGDKPSYPIKTNGGQFHNIYNNIVIGKDTADTFALYMQKWNPAATKYWVRGLSLNTATNINFTSGSPSRKDLLFSETWKNYYTNIEPTGQWKRIFEVATEENYNDAKAYLATGKTEEEMCAYAEKFMSNTEHTNFIYDNVFIDFASVLSEGSSWGKEYNNALFSASDAKSMFVDYGSDFNFTESGLATLSKTIPASELAKIDVDMMGVDDSFEGNVPEASNAVVSGGTTVGDTVYAEYDFSDIDGDIEGLSRIYWYISGSQNSGYKRIDDGFGRYLEVTEDMRGKYIRYEIVPYDITYAYGKTAVSEPLFVAYDLTSANAKIAEVEEIADSAVVGSEPGNYPQSAVDNLKTAIETAKKGIEDARTPSAIEDCLKALERAVTVFNNRVIKNNASDDEDTETPSAPSYGGGSSGGGGGGGSSSGGGNKVTYNGTTDSRTGSTQPVTPVQPSGSEAKFTDIIGHWAEKDILAMNEKGIVSGVTESTFEPDRNITRAEFATLIAKALELESGEADFADVKADDWFAPYVGAAAKAGIIVGSDGNFRPNDTITREEMAVIVVKAYEISGKTAEGAELTFADNAEISEWAKLYVAKAVGAGLISGMGDNMFSPKDSATRAQSASLIARILK